MSDWRIFVVSKGSYSNYHVLCAAPNESMAQAFAAAINAKREEYEDPAEVEELPLVRTLEELGPQVMHIVFLDLEGQETTEAADHRPRWTEYLYPWDDLWSSEVLERTWKGVPMVRGVSTRSFDEAIKAARDCLAEYKARKAGV